MSKFAKAVAKTTAVESYSVSAARDVKAVKEDMKLARLLLNTITTDDDDPDLEAGYDASKSGEIAELALECKILTSRADELDKQIEQTKNDLKAYDEVIPETQRDADNPAMRRKVAAQVVTYIVGSPTNFQTFLRGMGMPINEEINVFLQHIDSQVSSSQTDQWTQRVDQFAQLTSLQEQVKTKESVLNDVRHRADIQAEGIKLLKYMNAKLESRLEEAKGEITAKKVSVIRAKREAEKHNEKTVELQDRLAIMHMEKQALQERLSQCDNEKRASEVRSGELASVIEKMTLKAEEQKQDWQLQKSRLKRQLKSVSASFLFRLKGYQNKARDAKDKFKSAEAALASSEQRIHVANEEINVLQMDLLSEQEEARNKLEAAEEELDSVKSALTTCQSNLTQAQLDLSSLRKKSSVDENEIQRLLETSQELKSVKSDLATHQSELAQAKKSLALLERKYSADRNNDREELNLVKERVSSRDRKINELSWDLREKNVALEERNAVMALHLQNLEQFLRHVCHPRAKSSYNGILAGNILDNSARAMITTVQWRPWKLHNSWSYDPSLRVGDENKSLDAIALGIIALLSDKSASIVDLLSLLQSLQNMMAKSQEMHASIMQCLKSSVTDGLVDSRLHLMHRLMMYQLADLMGSDKEDMLPLQQCMDGVEPRVVALAGALKAWAIDPSVETPLPDSILSPGARSLVGFNGSPSGILCVDRSPQRLYWIDSSHIKSNFQHIELNSTTGTTYTMEISTQEEAKWAMLHL